MDRIREAVSKAREARGGSSMGPGAAGSPGRFSRGGAIGPESFIETTCKFDDFARNRIISNEQDPVLNAYRLLRTKVLQRMEENGWRTLAVVSPGAGAGKTVTAINLAIAVGASEASRTTLVDFDFYRPKVSKYLGFTEPPSLLDYFEGKKTLEQVTVKPDLPGMLVLPNERVTRRGAELVASARTDALIDKAVNQYGSRLVVFDLSPILGCDDTISFLPKVDCVLLVAASGLTRIREFKEAKRLLASANVIGTVLNKATSPFPMEGYYY